MPVRLVVVRPVVVRPVVVRPMRVAYVHVAEELTRARRMQVVGPELLVQVFADNVQRVVVKEAEVVLSSGVMC